VMTQIFASPSCITTAARSSPRFWRSDSRSVCVATESHPYGFSSVNGRWSSRSRVWYCPVLTWAFFLITVPETCRCEACGSKKVDVTRMTRSVWTRSEVVLPVLVVRVTLRIACAFRMSSGAIRLFACH
jgi:hypothetical protein